MSVKRFIIFAVLFLSAITFWILTSDEKELSDTFIVYGNVDTVAKSGNHAFGIIGFSIDSFVNGRIDTIEYELGKPYRVYGRYGEVYCAIPIGVEFANRVKINIPDKLVYLISGDSILFKSDIYFQSDKQNLKYIEKYSRFSNEAIK